jgi:hypothetical protein
MSMTIAMLQVLLARVLKCAKNRSVAVEPVSEPKQDPPHARGTTLDPAVQAAINDGNMKRPASLFLHPPLSLFLSLSLSLALSLAVPLSLISLSYSHTHNCHTHTPYLHSSLPSSQPRAPPPPD